MRLFIIILLSHISLFSCRMHKTASEPPPQPKLSFDIQGHRGCRGLMPENTIPAMIKAIQLGVTTLEMDVVITADNQVILSHEPFMSWEISTTPDGTLFTYAEEKKYNIYKMNYAEVQKWDVGSRPNPRFLRQEKMRVFKPLLADVIDSVESYIRLNHLPPVQYNIETKCQPSTDNLYHPEPAKFVNLLMQVIMDKKISDKVILQSFDIRTLKIMHTAYPNLRTALLIEGFNKNTLEENCKSLGFIPTIYSPEQNLVNAEMVADCQKKGMKLIPWTVNDKANIDKFKNLGVDGIITDYPDLLLSK
jgi:glycerophosphoryl diester phosphodiesterase